MASGSWGTRLLWSGQPPQDHLGGSVGLEAFEWEHPGLSGPYRLAWVGQMCATVPGRPESCCRTSRREQINISAE